MTRGGRSVGLEKDDAEIGVSVTHCVRTVHTYAKRSSHTARGIIMLTLLYYERKVTILTKYLDVFNEW